MLKIKNYVKAESLEEAYTLNQKRTSVVLGGMVWLKMGNRNVPTAIDLSGLGLDGITETDEEFLIGAMTPLRDLETHAGLNAYTCGAIRESLRHIVGVQFRNCATVGGSIWGRFGFSDVLTMFLALDAEVELYKGGVVPLSVFASMERNRDILVRLHVKKTPLRTVYLSQRNTKTDFPVLACAVSVKNGRVCTVYGARPGRALQFWDESGILDGFMQMEEEERQAAIGRFAELMQETVPTEGNMRASAEYRSHLVRVLTKRALTAAADLPDPDRSESILTGAAGAPDGGKHESKLFYPPLSAQHPGVRRTEQCMKLNFWLNGVKRETEIAADTLLLDLLRFLGCYSVKRGCETANCGLCTVLMEDRPVLSCSVLAVRAEGKHVTTLEGMQEKAVEFGAFLAGEGAEQCGFCNPGLIMNVFAMERELTDPTEEEIREYLAGNLCRCSGFVGQTRGILKYLEKKKAERENSQAPDTRTVQNTKSEKIKGGSAQ